MYQPPGFTSWVPRLRHMLRYCTSHRELSNPSSHKHEVYEHSDENRNENGTSIFCALLCHEAAYVEREGEGVVCGAYVPEGSWVLELSAGKSLMSKGRLSWGGSRSAGGFGDINAGEFIYDDILLLVS